MFNGTGYWVLGIRDCWMLNGANGPKGGSGWYWYGAVLGSNGKNRSGDQGSSPQHAAQYSLILGPGCMLTATTLLQEKATRKRRYMAAVTATQVTWGRMEVIIKLSSGHNLPQS